MTHTATAATVGPVTDDLGVVRIAKGAPIQIGGYWVLSGADTALGLDEKRGVEIAFDDIGNKLLGHPIKFNVEDDLLQCRGRPDRGNQACIQSADRCRARRGLLQCAATPAAPILWQQGIVNICNACSAPALTAPDRKPSYDGFARTIASDIDQGASDAKYIYTALKAHTLATVHDGSPYAQQLVSGHREELQATGRQGAVAGGGRADRCRHASGADQVSPPRSRT